MRILLVKTSSLGDVIHNLPVVSDLVRAIPGVHIDWCVEESFAAIPAMHPAVARVIPVALRRWRHHLLSTRTWREIAAFRRTLSAARYDAVLDTQGLLKSALMTRLAHGKRVGYAADSAREPLAARFYDQCQHVDRASHAVTRNRQLAAQALAYAIDPTQIDYGLAVAPLVADWVPTGPYVVCLTATSRQDKCWPAADWIELIAHLQQRGMTALLPAGSVTERQSAQAIAAAVGPAARLPPPLGIAALAGLLKGARATVGVDTGLSHLAAAVGTPTVALYTASDPGLTGVVGRGGCRNLGGRGRPPPVAEVLASVDEALAGYA